jgi:hypothetical protein
MADMVKWNKVFKTVAEHLHRQGMRAVDTKNDVCRYRGPDGTACAVGVLIPDADYSEKIEGASVIRLLEARCFWTDRVRALEAALTANGFTAADYPLLKALQQVHDTRAEGEVSYDWDTMYSRLGAVALSFKLDASVIPE